MNFKFYFLLMAITLHVNVMAQQAIELKTGDIITGTVYDYDGPMILVNVVEQDSSGRIVTQSITDAKGNFSFQLVNPSDSIVVAYKGYQTIKIPIEKKQHEIRLKMETSKENKNMFVRPKNMGVIESESYTMQDLQKYAPLDYSCGYVIRNPYNENICGIFLVKEIDKYNLVYKESGKTDIRSIEPELAANLESSVNNKIIYIDTLRLNRRNTEGGALPQVEIFYDANTVCALTPHKAAFYWTYNLSENLQDEIWQEEILKFRNETETKETAIMEDKAPHMQDSLLAQLGFVKLGVMNIPSGFVYEEVNNEKKTSATGTMEDEVSHKMQDSLLTQYGFVKMGILNFPSGFMSEEVSVSDSIMSIIKQFNNK